MSLLCGIWLTHLHTLTSDYPQVVNETGQPGTENEKDEPVGSQIVQFSRI